MNTLQLMEILRLPATKKFVLGVFPSDVTVKVKYPSGCIFNLSPRSGRGTHWVAVWFNARRQAIYYDSYGLPPIVKSIRKFIEKNSVSWTYNKRRLQSTSSTVCGNYAAAFIISRVTKQKFDTLFTKDYIKNDIKVLHFLYKYLLRVYGVRD